MPLASSESRTSPLARRAAQSIVLLAAVASASLSCRSPAATRLLKTVADIPLPGKAVRFDYQSFDSTSNRLYISHMNDDHLMVFDVASRKIIATIPEVPGATGVLAVPELGRVFASASRIGKVVSIDAHRLKATALIPAGQFPDGIAYDPDTKRLFVSDESGGADIVIDAKNNRQIARIKLGGSVGNTQYNPIAHTILATVGDTNELVSVDPRRMVVNGRYPLLGSAHPHGLYIDAPRGLAFVACEGNAKLLVVGLAAMKVISTFDVGDSPDVLAFDPGLHRLYVACESGAISIFDEQGATLIKRGDIWIAPEAHTVAVDGRTHLVYLPLEKVGGKPILRVMTPK